MENTATRKNIYRLNALATVVIAICILILINVTANYLYIRKDCTQTGMYAVSETTSKILSGLQKRFELVAFLRREDKDYFRVQQVCESICAESSKVTFRFVDADREPELADKYSCHSYKVMLVLNTETGVHEKIYSINEERIINSIMKLSRDGEKLVCFTTDHGERDIRERGSRGYYQLDRLLSQRGFKTEKISLAEKSIPKNCKFLVIAGAQTEFRNNEFQNILEYLRSGGRAMFLLEPSPAGFGFQAELGKLGFLVHDNLIHDESSKQFGSTPTVLQINSYGRHKSVEGMNLPTVFSGVREIELKQMLPDRFFPEIIARSGSKAYAQVFSKTPHPLKKKDFLGIAAVMRVVLEQVEGKPVRDYRIVLSGDCDFCSNHYLEMEGNKIFITNLISWLADESDIISVKSRKKSQHILHFTSSNLRSMFIITVLVFPVISILAGAYVFLRRRN